MQSKLVREIMEKVQLLTQEQQLKILEMVENFLMENQIQKSSEKLKKDIAENEFDSILPEITKEEKRILQNKWLKENYDKYRGLYIALDGDRLLGTGKNYPEAYEHARRAGIKDAFVNFIYPTDYVGEI